MHSGTAVHEVNATATDRADPRHLTSDLNDLDLHRRSAPRAIRVNPVAQHCRCDRTHVRMLRHRLAARVATCRDVNVEVRVHSARDRARSFYDGHRHPFLRNGSRGGARRPLVCGGGVISLLAQGDPPHPHRQRAPVMWNWRATAEGARKCAPGH